MSRKFTSHADEIAAARAALDAERRDFDAAVQNAHIRGNYARAEAGLVPAIVVTVAAVVATALAVAVLGGV